MIFVTVGSQLPFDRMVRAVDAWAHRRGRSDVLAQIGPSSTPPTHLRWTRFVSPDEFRAQMRQAELVVSHAGMGTILTAMEMNKPVVIMPRRADLREQRNDHQLATAKRLGDLGLVTVAGDAQALTDRLDHPESVHAAATHRRASAKLIGTLRSFVENAGDGARPRRVLAVASGGGHWIQLLRMVPALHGHEVVYVTTRFGDLSPVNGARVYEVPDANRWDKLGMLRLAANLGTILLREKPDVVISTGAAPGYFAVRIAQLMRRRTVWVDSIANAEQLSLSGQRIGRHADLWLTQWPHLAHDGRPGFVGSVLDHDHGTTPAAPHDARGAAGPIFTSGWAQSA